MNDKSLTDYNMYDDEMYFKKRPSYDLQRRSSIVPEKVVIDGNGKFPRHGVVEMPDRKTDHVVMNEDPDLVDMLRWEKRTANIAYRFLVTTTAHGWAHVARGYNTAIKIFWLFLTLSAFFINVVHVMVLVMQFQKYPYEQVCEFTN